ELHRRHISKHRGELFLDQLIMSNWSAKLLSIQCIACCVFESRHAVPKRFPRCTPARCLQNTVYILEGFTKFQPIFAGDSYVLDCDIRLQNGALAYLAFNNYRLISFRKLVVSLFNNKSFDFAICLISGIQDGDICSMAVPNPSFVS